jgi:GntR family transcriptional regulator/MocR family aminotransferase
MTTGAAAGAGPVASTAAAVARAGATGGAVSGASVPPQRARSAAGVGPDRRFDLRPGRANRDGFPLAAWRAAWRRATYAVPFAESPPALGLPALRAAVTEYLRRTRGLVLHDHTVVITAGQRHGVAVLLNALGRLGPRPAPTEVADVHYTRLAPGWQAGAPAIGAQPFGAGLFGPPAVGARPVGAQPVGAQPAGPPAVGAQPAGAAADGVGVVAFEEPSPPELRHVAEQLDWRVVGADVDADGIRVDTIHPDAAVVVVSPERHEPLGGVLTAARRERLLDDAVAAGRLVVEVGYERALSRDDAPRPPLLAQPGAERVVLVGSFAPLLTSALGLGYLVVPRALAPAVAQILEVGGGLPSAVAQRTLADLLEDGVVARRVDRLAALAKAKREVLRSAFAGIVPPFELRGCDSGTRAVLVLPPQLPARAVAHAAHRYGVHVTCLDEYYFSGRPRLNGLVLGYGHLDEAALRAGLARLARGIAEACGGGGGPSAARRGWVA